MDDLTSRDLESAPRRTARVRRLPEIRVKRPRCPRCGCVRLIKDRSISDQSDGSALWWVHCANDECGHRFRVILE